MNTYTKQTLQSLYKDIINTYSVEGLEFGIEDTLSFDDDNRVNLNASFIACGTVYYFTVQDNELNSAIYKMEKLLLPLIKSIYQEFCQ